jgi:hypothetical protein
MSAHPLACLSSSRPASRRAMRAACCLAVLLPLAAGTAWASPITLTVNAGNDTQTEFIGSITGSLTETPFVEGTKMASPWGMPTYDSVRSDKYDLAKVGANWNVWGHVNQTVYWLGDAQVGLTYDLWVYGQHMVAVDDHLPAEDAPNNLTSLLYYLNLDGSSGWSSGSSLLGSVPHLPTTHPDVMTLKVFDLNGADKPGVLNIYQVAAEVSLIHLPVPGALPLTVAGLGGVGIWTRRKRNEAVSS